MFLRVFLRMFFHELCSLKSGELSSSVSTKLYTVSTKMSYKLIQLYGKLMPCIRKTFQMMLPRLSIQKNEPTTSYKN